MTKTKQLMLTFLGAAMSIGGALAQPIKIGSFLSVTGPASLIGEPELNTLQLYVDTINRDGGVLGRKLELVSYDDGSEAGKANAFAKRLIEDDKVDVILGGSTTGSSMSVIPLVEKAGVPLISLAAGVGIVEPVKRWVFKMPHTDRMAAEKILVDMKAKGVKQFALLSESNGFGQSGRKEVLAAATNLGLDVVTDETYASKDTDMTSQLTKIKNNPKAQAVFIFGMGQGAAIATKNYQQLSIKLPLYHSHGVASDEFIQLAGPAAEGVRLPAAASLLRDKLPELDVQRKVVMDFAKAYTSRYKTEISTFGGHAYDALMIYVAAVKKANSTDKEKVRTAIEQTKSYVGTGGLVNMSATDHMGLDLSAFRMIEIRKGQWTIAP